MQIFQRNSFLLLLIGGLLGACSRPMANFSYSGEATAPAQISFENTSENADSYEWDFGDGTLSNDSLASHRYRSSGAYTVTLKAMKGKKVRSKQIQLNIAPPKECLIEIETNYGNMLVRLFDDTPKHQDNFLKLAEQGYFDSLLFHRVIQSFMIQGGDPKSKNAPQNRRLGSGGPGYMVDAEFRDTLVHTKGMLAAARIGGPSNPKKRSSGSQFYLVQGRPVTADMLDRIEAQKGRRYSKSQREAYLDIGGTPQLDWEYTVFGQVIEGLEVIDEIASQPTNSADRPKQDVFMIIRAIN